jgi:N-acetylglucosaminyldiphosphoundecaprenol N-acetyl-beta-D-mannosaminyltransferase
MPKSIQIKEYNIFSESINTIEFDKFSKTTINTINAHSYIVAKKDSEFRNALVNSQILLPDGEGIVFMAKQLKGKHINKIAGADIHQYLLDKAQDKHLKCFYLGASESTLDTIKRKQEKTYPNIEFGFFSPPFKNHFSKEDTKAMIQQVNGFKPDILFVGMTAPKQEKWVYQNKAHINANVICSIGAVFDFVAETKKRAPQWMIQLRMEWLHRALSSWRLTKRYMYSNPLFIWEVIRLKITRQA